MNYSNFLNLDGKLNRRIFNSLFKKLKTGSITFLFKKIVLKSQVRPSKVKANNTTIQEVKAENNYYGIKIRG